MTLDIGVVRVLPEVGVTPVDILKAGRMSPRDWPIDPDVLDGGLKAVFGVCARSGGPSNVLILKPILLVSSSSSSSLKSECRLLSDIVVAAALAFALLKRLFASIADRTVFWMSCSTSKENATSLAEYPELFFAKADAPWCSSNLTIGRCPYDAA